MEIRPRLVPLIAFFSLVFLLHELHDWAHAMAAGGLCHCWAPRSFDSWTLCPNCILEGRQRLLIWILGPMINYIAIWAGWRLMNPENTLERRSIGFCLVFAALPFMRILAAAMGGGDETSALRQLLEPFSLTHHRVLSLIGLLVVLAATLPSLIRAFLLLPGGRGKLLIFPVMLLLPGYVDHWVVQEGMNKLQDMGFLNHLVVTGLHLIVVVWGFFVLFLFALSHKGLSHFLDYDEKLIL
jgi:hypothetical protein